MALLCSVCTNFSAPTIALLVRHLSLEHGNESNLNILCGLESCPRTFRKISSFKSHITRDHKNLSQTAQTKSVNTQVQVSCKECQEKFTEMPYLMQHMKVHLSTNLTMQCPIFGCDKKYTVFSSFASHMSRKHPNAKIEDARAPQIHLSEIEDSDLAHTQAPDCQIDDDDIIYKESDSELSGKYLKHLALFFMKIQEKYALPASTVQNIVEDVTNLLELTGEELGDRMKQVMEKHQIGEDASSDIMKCLQEDILQHSMPELGTEWKREKYFKENLGYKPPTTVSLGRNKNHKECSFQYVSLRGSLERLLKKSEILHQVLNPKPKKGKLLKDFRDGRYFKANVLFQNNPNALQIFLYIDEFEVVNVLGSARGLHKISGVYYILGNIYPEKRGPLRVIQLVSLCLSEDVKQFGLDRILETVIRELEELEITGIVIPEVPIPLKVGLAFVSGDNLGSHQIGGFHEGFSGRKARICRFCLATGEEIQDKLNPYCFECRTEENYNEGLKEIYANPAKASEVGIKRNSILNRLQYFHVVSGLPADIMHDILEGVAPFEVALIIRQLIKDDLLSLDYVNGQIRTWPYGKIDSRNKPAEISKNFSESVNQSSAQMWCLLRMLPCMIGPKVPEDNLYFRLLLLLDQITEYVFAPALLESHCAYIHSLIQQHNTLFKELFPEKRLKPKHHYMSHYPELILNYGPLRVAWCMRFEGKHSYFKSLMNRLQNFINVCYSLAKRHELHQAYQFSSSSNFLTPDFVVSHSTSMPVDMYSERIQMGLKEMGFTEGRVSQVHAIEINGLPYDQDMYVVCDVDEDGIVFGRIECVFIQSQKVALLLEEYKSHHDDHLNCYILAGNCHNGDKSVWCLDDLIDHYPLTCISIHGKQVIILKHFVFNTKCLST